MIRKMAEAEINLDEIESLTRVYGAINKLRGDQIRHELEKRGMRAIGNKQVISRQLKAYFKKKHAHQHEQPRTPRRDCDIIIVIDVEATCDTGEDTFPHEIIELPAVAIERSSGDVLGEFQTHVRPTLNPKLSEYCTELTGIVQADVAEAPLFPDALQSLLAFVDQIKAQWLAQQKPGTPVPRVHYASDGPWDYRDFLQFQCRISDIDYPKEWRAWIDVRRLFYAHYKLYFNKEHRRSFSSGVACMLDGVGMKFEGREHSGIDDTRNIARLVTRLIEDEAPMKTNTDVQQGPCRLRALEPAHCALARLQLSTYMPS
eukprot:m.119145 g.119145  ORF g.119145 m.119145 type:complete len:316 (-) comp15582_c0_seq10:302-1249(-)